MSRAASIAEVERGFFGHPVSLKYLAFTEVWERFSYYGMQALLPLYMVQHLLLDENIAGVWGFGRFRSAIEAVTGPLSNIALTTQIFGVYVFGVYLAVLLGGWVGDRFTGRKVAVLIGGVGMAIGHLLMAWESLFLIALLCLMLGAGMYKGNLIMQVGALYVPADLRRTRAFGILLIAGQIGALMAPIVCGTLGEVYGWHVGFSAAAVGMIVGLAGYGFGMRLLPEQPAQAASDRPAPAGTQGAMFALGLVFFSYFMVIAAVMQGYSIGLIWAVDHVDRVVFGFRIPVTWVLIFDALALTGAMLLSMKFWVWQSRTGEEMSDYSKIVAGSMMCSIGLLILSIFSSFAGDGKVPLFAVAAFFGIVGFGIAFIDSPLKALTTRCAPAHLSTMLVGIMLATFGVANLAAGWLGRYYEQLGPASFWLLSAAIAAAGPALLLLFRKPATERLERSASERLDRDVAMPPLSVAARGMSRSNTTSLDIGQGIDPLSGTHGTAVFENATLGRFERQDRGGAS